MSETNGDAEAAGRWRERLGGIINGTDIFFNAAAAAQQCSAGKGGCGLRWWRGGVNDGEVGVGEQMSALEVMQNLLVDQVSGPVGLDTGGISEHDPITTGDKAGAAILTIVVFAVFLGGGGWLIM